MTALWIPQDKAELLAAIEHEWRLLLDVAEKLSPEKRVAQDEGGWSPKDHLAHLSGWMQILMQYHMDKRPSHEVLGVKAEISNQWNFDDINRHLLARNQDRAWEDVLGELQQTYAQLRARLDALSFEALQQPYSETESMPILAWVLGNTVDHFAEHRRTLEKN